MESTHAILILSGVAGLSRGNHSVWPSSALAAKIASFIAKRTAELRKNGGSPTALEECMTFGFGAPCNGTSNESFGRTKHKTKACHSTKTGKNRVIRSLSKQQQVNFFSVPRPLWTFRDLMLLISTETI